jgi:hypothetical protein
MVSKLESAKGKLSALPQTQFTFLVWANWSMLKEISIPTEIFNGSENRAVPIPISRERPIFFSKNDIA